MLKVGVYKEKITPDTNLKGSFRLHWDKVPKGIHDDLFADALYMDDGNTRLLLISLHILSVTNETGAELREAVSARTSVPVRGIMISCTHTHNGHDSLNEGNDRHPRIMDDLKARVVHCAAMALENAVPGAVGFGDVCIAVARNRLAKNMTGATDPVCDIMKIEDMAGNIISLCFHYSAHPTAAMCSEYMISRDCIGYAVDALEREFACNAIFFQGAAGNTNFKLGERAYEHAQRIGLSFAEFISNRVKDIKCSSDISLACDEQLLTLEKRTDYDFNINELNEKIAEARQRFDSLIESEDDSDKIYVAFNTWRVLVWKKMLYDSNKLTSHLNAQIQVFKIGEADIVMVPGEIFVEYQLAFRADVYPRRGMVFGYANGYVGYIITNESARLGGFYGSQPSFVQQLYPAAGEKMMSAGLEMLNKQ